MNKRVAELVSKYKREAITVEEWKAFLVASGINNEGVAIASMIACIEGLIESLISSEKRASEMALENEDLRAEIKALRKEGGNTYKLGGRSVAEGRRPAKKPGSNPELIKKLHDMGYSYRDIANKLDISVPTIYRVMRQYKDK